jgi:predicted NUDIX family phosphoesterase
MPTEDRPGKPGAPPVDEEVFVVPRADLLSSGFLPRGFAQGACDRFLELTARAGRFILRRDAETDPSLKQIIPYAIVGHGDLVFLFERTGGGGESRLHRKLSIGVGGHINPEGVSADRLVDAGLRRELSEELAFDVSYDYRPIGLINDDDSPVGQVHLGIVYLVTAHGDQVRVRETEILEGGFVPRESLRALLPRMESWSRLVAESIFFKPHQS